jgi:RNA polymerase sigma-70 factor (ECF subfamily)
MSEARNDQLLISRCQEGDRAAFDDLIAKHEQRAYQFAYRLTNNPDEAADIVSDAFIRVYNALPNFRGQSAFTTWLYRILTNCYLDYRKRDRNRQHASLESNLQTEHGEVERQVEDLSDGPVEMAERSAREVAIQRALRRLPEYQQAMLVMYHVEQLSYEEIAEAQDLPIGTVKSRLNRARLSLRDLLAKDEELFLID